MFLRKQLFNTRKVCIYIAAAVLLLAGMSSRAFAQTNSGSISGTVQDSAGALIPGATVRAVQQEQHQPYTAVSDGHGHYAFPDVIPGTYNISITASGFKEAVQTGLTVDASSKVAAGNTVMAIGATTEIVSVSAEGQHVQTDNATKSENITNDELLDLPIDSGSGQGRSFFGALATIPGIQSFQPNGPGINITINGSAQGQTNLTVDGILNVDAGNNGQVMIDVNADNVGELNVTTSNAGAGFGREQNTISLTTASGTSKYHGEFTWFHRHEGLNANTWANKRTGTITPRSKSRLNEFSANFSGPVSIPHLWNSLHDKMFFFVGEDVQKPLLAATNHYVNLPTYAESLGDFSQSVDKNGRPIYLTDYTAPGTGSCTAKNTVANPGRCFVGVSQATGQTSINVISPGRQSAAGQAILANYKNYIPAAGYLGYPNAGKFAALGQTQPGQKGFNYLSAVPNTEDYRQDIYRIDYNPTPSIQSHVRWANLKQLVGTAYGYLSDTGNLPTTTFAQDTPGHGIAIGSTQIINQSTTNEVTIGFNVSKIHVSTPPGALSPGGLGLPSLPLLFNPAQTDQIPDLEFGGQNLANSPQIVVNDVPYHNAFTAMDALDNFTKIVGSHQIQAGVQYERVRKDQFQPGAVGGQYQFGDDANNPFDTSNAYANAITGVFDTFTQASAWREGKFRYGNLDFYGQDTWRATPRLTLIGGLRVQHWSPWYDASGQSLNFDPSKFSGSAAPRVYLPSGNGAVDPGTGATAPKAYAGLLVPGSGNFDNGLVSYPGTAYTNNLGTPIPQSNTKYLYNTTQWLYSPHVGLTFDPDGGHHTVFRLGAATYYDRFQGNPIFGLLTNPPSVQTSSLYYGTFASVSGSSGLSAPSNVNALSIDKIVYPVTYQFNVEMQRELPFRSLLSIGYIGNRSSHLQQTNNLNWSPYGSTFLPQNQNPTGTSVIPGANSYTQVEINTYRGLGNINTTVPTASSNYNGLQITASRKSAHGLFLTATYVWSKTLGVSGFDHLGRTRALYYNPVSTDRRHTLQATYSYTIPSFFHNALLHGAIDGWQVSGITTLFSGVPFSIGQTVYVPGSSVALSSANLTGSYTEGGRVQLLRNPFIGANHSGAYGRLNPAALQASPQGSAASPYLGTGVRPFSFYGPGLIDTDLTLTKNIALKTDRVKLQLRADAFNVFNHVNYTGYNTTVTFPGGPNAVGSADTSASALNSANVASSTNTSAFGGVNGAQAPRTMALMARIRF